MPGSKRSRVFVVFLVAVALATLAPAGAGAATVVNGNFETASLSGWQVYNSSPNGNWFAYSGAAGPISGKPQFPPPSGGFAATSDEVSSDTPILYQDVALEPYYSHSLGLTLYYVSQAPIFVPNPNTLSSNPKTTEHNQQLRVDVMKPTAPIESLDPTDILATVFANKNGDPTSMAPTRLSADLTPFGGQTVRLRIANAVLDYYFLSGVDDVSITSTPPSNAFTKGKLTLNKKKGTGKLAIAVPGPGTLMLVGKGSPKRIRNANRTATAAGTLKLPLNPNGSGKKALNAKGKLKTKIAVTFTPTGGTAKTQTFKVTLKKALSS
jgi:hypothetical protein